MFIQKFNLDPNKKIVHHYFRIFFGMVLFMVKIYSLIMRTGLEKR